MIFDIALMGTPSFLEGSSVSVFPFAPPQSGEMNEQPSDKDPMMRIGLITGCGL
jgi:hypothetical protein